MFSPNHKISFLFHEDSYTKMLKSTFVQFLHYSDAEGSRPSASYCEETVKCTLYYMVQMVIIYCHEVFISEKLPCK